MKKLINCFLAALLLLNASCEDDNIFKQLVDPPAKVLPPATQIGANTFGCKINGEVWLPRETAWMEFINGGLSIVARNKWEASSAVSIHIAQNTISNIGSYQLGNQTPYKSRGSYSNDKTSPNINVFATDDVNTGSINISRIDTNKFNYIISGTFNFKARNELTGEVIEITEGRFDLRKQ